MHERRGMQQTNSGAAPEICSRSRRTVQLVCRVLVRGHQLLRWTSGTGGSPQSAGFAPDCSIRRKRAALRGAGIAPGSVRYRLGSN